MVSLLRQSLSLHTVLLQDSPSSPFRHLNTYLRNADTHESHEVHRDYRYSAPVTIRRERRSERKKNNQGRVNLRLERFKQ
ncbi:hypothetical protein Y1Q_0015709 [Alligator mississippiensis]|uniref:Uncharacterized protein n=1 Tax=Alligator mississippiensis TaxID=8496 RepID=A0A151NP42_ALLMI|nr:hypothetical protein Y1Q_0015709 [Alligator mississippiensis]